jgi:hypothetical protein
MKSILGLLPVLAIVAVACSRPTLGPDIDDGFIKAKVDSGVGVEWNPPVVTPQTPAPAPTPTPSHYCLDDLGKFMKVRFEVASDQDYYRAIAAGCKDDEPALAEAARMASMTASWIERARILHGAALADSRFDKKCELGEKDVSRQMQKLLDDGTVRNLPPGPTGWTTCELTIMLDWCAFPGGVFEYFSVFMKVAHNPSVSGQDTLVLDQFARHLYAVAPPKGCDSM